jgi:polyphenol oxidase
MLKEPFFLSPIKTIEGVSASFTQRVIGVDVICDRDEAMLRLHNQHTKAVSNLGFSENDWVQAEQVHGNNISVVKRNDLANIPHIYPEVDGLVTNERGIVLAIYVADCGVIWLVDQKTKAIGLLHSGKKGTESNILKIAIEKMKVEFGSNPIDIIAVLGPCIRPPHYEINFAAEIRKQASKLGIIKFHDCGICTGSDLENYYSYRKELGKTGRMMALLGKNHKAP